MSNIEIHVLHTGHVCVSPNLPYGGINCSTLKASGLFFTQNQTIMVTSF